MDAEIPEIEKPVQVFAIRAYPDEMLSSIALPWVESFADSEFQGLIASLEATMMAHGAAGLAGPQVGIPYRIITVLRDAKAFTMINPVVIEASGEQASAQEGCLSFKGLGVKVRRPAAVRVQFMTPAGVSGTLTFIGTVGRAVQHEIDHLNGVVFIDRIPKVMRSEAMRRYRLAPRVARQSDGRVQKLLKQLRSRETPRAPVETDKSSTIDAVGGVLTREIIEKASAKLLAESGTI